MPDHILELWIQRDGGFPLPALIVEEGDAAPTLEAAVRQYEERVRRSWAGDPTLRLEEEKSLRGKMRGTLVTFEKSPYKGAKAEPLTAAVFLVSGTAIEAMSSLRSPESTDALRTVFLHLDCKSSR
jgi:hypothetical protein